MPEIFIGIRSCYAHKEHRDAQRETWIPYLDKFRDAGIIDYKYFVGSKPVLEPNVIATASVDLDTHLTHKTRAMLEYAFNRRYKWFFLCNDTTYVSPFKLLSSGFQFNDYTGIVLEKSEFGVPYINGHALWFSQKSMGLILESGCLDRVSRSDDAIIGRELFGQVVFNNDPRYGSFRVDTSRDPKHNNEYITAHNCSPEITRIIHENYFK